MVQLKNNIAKEMLCLLQKVRNYTVKDLEDQVNIHQ